MAANFTESTSTHAARTVSSLERYALGLERQTGNHREATAHSRGSDVKDVQMVVELLMIIYIFTTHAQHSVGEQCKKEECTMGSVGVYV